MTVYGFLAAVVWSGVCCYIAWRVDGWIRAHFLSLERLALARLGVKERIALLKASDEARGKHRKDALTSIEIPDDLEAVAGLESELWAQDDVRGMIREKFTTLGDWQKVRRAVGVAEMP